MGNLIGFALTPPGLEFREKVAVELQAGEASLHSFHAVHWSGPNRTRRRRVALAIRYVAADIMRGPFQQPMREFAMLAAGSYDASSGAFDLEPVPLVDVGEAELAVHR